MRAISQILRNTIAFTSLYPEIIDYTVYTITPDEMKIILETIVPNCDLVLSQPVSESYRDTNVFSTKKLIEYIGEKSKHIIVPNCYFTGYDPRPFQTSKELEFGSYYPTVSFESLVKKDIIQACKDWCNPDIYSIQEIEENSSKSLANLRDRESNIFDTGRSADVAISDYIQENWKNVYLFHTYNHPSNTLLIELARRILHILGIPSLHIGRDISAELLGDFSFPPSPCVYLGTTMSFAYPKIRIKGVEYTTIEAMKRLSESLCCADKDDIENWISTVRYLNGI